MSCFYKKFKFLFFIFIFSFIFISTFFLTSCKENSVENIKLFNTSTNTIENINFEKYIEGVVAGEMQNTAPIEALKTQAILARTFALKFIDENKSKYTNFDISTDIKEAQAYAPEKINENIKKAVKDTAGLVIKYNNEYINAWFHSNSGGYTASAKEGLNISIDEPDYIKSVKTKENLTNTKNYYWKAIFSKDEILNTLRNMGISISNISTFKTGEKGNSGRTITFIVGGKELSANTFRLNIGSTKLKSTLITSINVSDENITFEGNGYGHGVGLSQEYAIVLANEGFSYKDIINYFFKNIKITQNS